MNFFVVVFRHLRQAPIKLHHDVSRIEVRENKFYITQYFVLPPPLTCRQELQREKNGDILYF